MNSTGFWTRTGLAPENGAKNGTPRASRPAGSRRGSGWRRQAEQGDRTVAFKQHCGVDLGLARSFLSSSVTISMFRPCTPPLAFTAANQALAPSRMSVPNLAFPPVSGADWPMTHLSLGLGGAAADRNQADQRELPQRLHTYSRTTSGDIKDDLAAGLAIQKTTTSRSYLNVQESNQADHPAAEGLGISSLHRLENASLARKCQKTRAALIGRAAQT